MLYLSGAIRKELIDPLKYGFMRTPNMGNAPIAGMPWGADTGCFSLKGERGFDLPKYLGWLDEQGSANCLFATAPDKVGDAETTLSRSLPVLPLIRQLKFKAAFVGQDHIEETEVPWDAFDVFFVGGTTDWKLGPVAKFYVEAARIRGKWVHMGRVNSYKRFKYAADLGCDSVDGTFLAFGPAKNLPRLESWFTKYAQEASK